MKNRYRHSRISTNLCGNDGGKLVMISDNMWPSMECHGCLCSFEAEEELSYFPRRSSTMIVSTQYRNTKWFDNQHSIGIQQVLLNGLSSRVGSV